MKSKNKKAEEYYTDFIPTFSVVSDPVNPLVTAAREAIMKIAVEMLNADIAKGETDTLYFDDRDAQEMARLYLEEAFSIVEEGLIISAKETKGK